MKLDANALRYMTKDEFRVLTAVELVPMAMLLLLLLLWLLPGAIRRVRWGRFGDHVREGTWVLRAGYEESRDRTDTAHSLAGRPAFGRRAQAAVRPAAQQAGAP